MTTAAWWASRRPGERHAMGALALLAIASLAFAFAWLPAERSRSRLATEIPELRSSIALMRAQAGEVKRLRAQPARVASAAPLATLLASGTLAQGLPGAKVSAVDGKRMKLVLDDGSWTRLLEWLAAARGTHGLSVESARVEALPAAGRVRAEFVLAAP